LDTHIELIAISSIFSSLNLDNMAKMKDLEEWMIAAVMMSTEEMMNIKDSKDS